MSPETLTPGHLSDPVIIPSRGPLECIGMADHVILMGGVFTMWETREAWEEHNAAGWGDEVPPPMAEGLGLIAMRLSSDGMTTEYGEPLMLQSFDDLVWNSRWNLCALEGSEAGFVYSGTDEEVRLRVVNVDLGTLSLASVQDISVVSNQEFPEWAEDMPWGDTPWVQISQGTMGLSHLGAGMMVVAMELDAYLPGSRFPVHPDYPAEETTEWLPVMIPIWKMGSSWEAGPFQYMYVPPSLYQGRDLRYGDLHVIDNKTVCSVFTGEGGAGIAVVAKVDRSTTTMTIGPRSKFCWGVEDWFLAHPDPLPDPEAMAGYVVEREGIDVGFTGGSSCLVRGGILAVGGESENAGALGIPHSPVAVMRLLKIRGYAVEKVDVRAIGESARYRCATLAGGRAVVSRDMPPDMGNPYAKVLPGWTGGMGGYVEVVGVVDNRLKILHGLGQGMTCMDSGPVPT